MRIYIAGKITGLPIEEVRQKFKVAEDQINKEGFIAINPMELQHDHDKRWESYMVVCIAAMILCDALYMLLGWHESKGAILEHSLALQLGIPIVYETGKPKYAFLFQKKQL